MVDTNGSDDDEQRRQQRGAITLVVEYEGADDLVADYTENLSTGGTFINTSHDFDIGARISLVLAFPGLITPIELSGVVRWTRSGEADVRGVGIEFDALEDESAQMVAELVERIHSRDPDVVNQLCKVLVVEDNPHVAKLIRDGLRGSGSRIFGNDVAFNFRTANDGAEALEILAKERFDALIIDVYMPVLDGASVIARVRADESIASLPIIAVSAGGESARASALSAGANFFLHKPMRLRQIIETMRKLLDSASDD